MIFFIYLLFLSSIFIKMNSYFPFLNGYFPYFQKLIMTFADVKTHTFKNIMNTFFSVIMPTYNHSAFIRRAILSLYKQTYSNWELIIINDGCTDETEMFISDFLDDERIVYIKNENNRGLGHALNQGIRAAKYNLIAYLPSDDYYFENHLETIKKSFELEKDVVLVYTGVRYDAGDSLFRANDTESKGIRKGFEMQLVQTAHKKVNEWWVERSEWISDDLFAMYWRKLTVYGSFTRASNITCFWTSHPYQRHSIISEKHGGGLNRVRNFYKIQHPIRIRIAKEKFWDEYELYSDFKNITPAVEEQESLKILIVGELAYNPERILALEQAGHKLYGLWIPEPRCCISTVGPLPFGHVEDLSNSNWQEEIKRVQPDVIYALLNWEAIAWSCSILKAFPDIPFVWHFKEGLSVSLRAGNWDKLIYLFVHSTARIFLNEVVKRWFEQFILSNGLFLIMDGDLPKLDYFKENFSSKLSSKDREIHTVVAGRMFGISDQELDILVKNNIHIHLYTENYHAAKAKQLAHYCRKYPHYFHIHPHCPPGRWTEEFSKYDAGWLHCLRSDNKGNLLKATWDDLNIPARVSTYASAGLPIIQRDNSGNIVAVEECLRRLDIGVFFSDFYDLSKKLRDKERMNILQENVLKERKQFSFDYHIPELISLFREAIKKKRNG